jgi:hypothetical protein
MYYRKEEGKRMKKILLVLLLLTSINNVNAMEVYDDTDAATTTIVEVIEEDKPVTKEYVDPTEKPIDRNTSEIEPEYRTTEEEMEPTLYTEDEELLVDDMIKITSIVDKEDNSLLIYGVSGIIVVASGLAIYLYNKRKEAA